MSNFFEKQAIERLGRKYNHFSFKTFLATLKKTKLYEMDDPNKQVGITEKLWWEKYVGKVTNKDVLEVGCGVNYIVPYWLHTKNRVTAFDPCAESISLLTQILKKLGLLKSKLRLFTGDISLLVDAKTFDIINVNNVLHHVKDKPSLLKALHGLLDDDGLLLLVEPNYYYPPRWIIETDFMEKFNFVKAWFVKHNLIEQGEKAIVFSELNRMIAGAGFVIKVNRKDSNYLGYAITYFLKPNSFLANVLYAIDQRILKYILPSKFAPFEYLILEKRK